MADPTHGTVLSEARIRTLLAELGEDVYNLGDQIVYSKAFHSEEWPRGVYALDRTDMDALLALLDQARTLRLARPSQAVDPAVHTPERIGAYLRSHGWSIDRPGVIASLWAHPDRPGDDARVLVPSTNRGSDYPKRVGEIAKDLADIEGVGELQVLKDIAEAGDE